MPHPFSACNPLEHICWHSCRVVLRNTHAAQAREHPLSIFDAIFKFAAGTMTGTAPLMLFHPLQPLEPVVVKGRDYALELVFPQDGDKATAFLQTLAHWLKNPTRHFSLVACGPVQRHTPQSLHLSFEQQHPQLLEKGELCMDFFTPLPHISTDKSRKRWIDASTVIAQCCQRVQRVYGPQPSDAWQAITQAASTVATLPWMWRYEEFHHTARSAQGTKYINGFMGPLWLRGEPAALQLLLPLLLTCSYLHMGKRLHAGQGAFQLCPNKTWGDSLLQDRAIWYMAGKKLFGTPPEAAHLGLMRQTAMQDAASFHGPECALRRQVLCLLLLKLLRHAFPACAHAFEKVTDGHHAAEGTTTTPHGSTTSGGAAITSLLELLPLADVQSRALLLYEAATPCADDLSRLLHIWHSQQEPQPACGACPSLPSTSETDEQTATPAWRKTLHILHPGAAVGMDEEGVLARYDGKNLLRVPLSRVESIMLHGAGSVSLPLLRHCLDADIPVVFCSTQGTLQGMLHPENANWYHRMEAHAASRARLGEQGRLCVAAHIIAAKVESYLQWLPSAMPEERTMLVEAGKSALKNLGQAHSLAQLLGIEGAFARLCFRSVNSLVIPEAFHSPRRQARRRADRWNALLDTVSAWLFSHIHAHLRAQGLNPFAGFLHTQHDRFATLAADIQELFRHRTDRWLVRVLNQGILTATHVQWKDDAFTLTREGRAIALDFFAREMQTRLSADVDTLGALLEEQVRLWRMWLCEGHAPTILLKGQWHTFSIKTIR